MSFSKLTNFTSQVSNFFTDILYFLVFQGNLLDNFTKKYVEGKLGSQLSLYCVVILQIAVMEDTEGTKGVEWNWRVLMR